jgi:hypothetical protein
LSKLTPEMISLTDFSEVVICARMGLGQRREQLGAVAQLALAL